MPLLVISHSAVVPAYLQKWHMVSNITSNPLVLVIPERWPEGGKMVIASQSGNSHLNLRVCKIFFPGRLGIFLYKGLEELINEVSPSLIYIEEEPFSLSCFQAARLARKREVPFVFFSWENILRTFPWWQRCIQNYILKNSAGAVLGNSESVCVYEKLLFDGKVCVIPQYGVNTETFRPATENKGPFTVGFMGRLVREKGVDLLIEALKGTKIPLLLAGDGPERRSLELLAKKCNVTIRFLGFLPFEKRHSFFSRIHCLCLPSRTTRNWKEQFGRVLAEAMASGVPCIGSDSGAIPEVIGKGGLVFRQNDIFDLRDKILKMQSELKKESSFGLEGRKRVKKKFSEEVIACSLVNFLKQFYDA